MVCHANVHCDAAEGVRRDQNQAAQGKLMEPVIDSKRRCRMQAVMQHVEAELVERVEAVDGADVDEERVMEVAVLEQMVLA